MSEVLIIHYSMLPRLLQRAQLSSLRVHCTAHTQPPSSFSLPLHSSSRLRSLSLVSALCQNSFASGGTSYLSRDSIAHCYSAQRSTRPDDFHELSIRPFPHSRAMASNSVRCNPMDFTIDPPIPALPTAADVLVSNGVTVVTAHSAGDFDALGSMVAAHELVAAQWGRSSVESSGNGKCVLLWAGSMESQLESYIHLHYTSGNSSVAIVKELPEDDIQRIDSIIVVDTRRFSRLKHIHDILPARCHPRSPQSDTDMVDAKGDSLCKEVLVVTYDHHPATSDDIIADAQVVREWGSCSAILTHAIASYNQKVDAEAGGMDSSIPLVIMSPSTATSLALGIHHDTGNFTFASTSVEDMSATAYLRSGGINHDILRNYLPSDHSSSIVDDLSQSERDIYQQLVRSASVHDINGQSVVIVQAASDEGCKSFANIVDHFFARGSTAAKVDGEDTVMESSQPANIARNIFAIGRFQKNVVIVGRSKSKEDLNVGEVCRSFGGGGHHCAASATIRDMTPNEVRDELFTHIHGQCGTTQSVTDVMTQPPVTIPSTSTVAEALEILHRYNLKKMPVTRGQSKECIGILDRIAAEKVRQHKLGDSSTVEDFMEVRFSCLSESAPVEKAIELILRKHQRVIPVLRSVTGRDGESSDCGNDGEIIGVISRSDLIQMIMKEPSRFPRLSGKGQRVNCKKMMHKTIPKSLQRILRDAATLADELGVQCYVVGGFVRDLLLHRPNDDIDFVVEGNGIEFADRLGRLWGSNVRHHAAFGTAVVHHPQTGLKIDVAMARLEYYPIPVALPVVELSSLKMDLYRRDFTVNAMAIALNKGSFGDLVDFFNSYEDLKLQTIQVLHSLSFVEDPTRIFRAVRFEQRYQWSISQQTMSLIQSASKLGVVEKLSSGRLFHEFQKILSEDTAVHSIMRLNGPKFKLLSLIHPTLDESFSDSGTSALMEDCDQVIHMYRLAFIPAGQHSSVDTTEFWKVRFVALLSSLSDEDFVSSLSKLAIADGHQSKFIAMRQESNKLFDTLTGYRSSPSPKEIYHYMHKLPTETLLLCLGGMIRKHGHVRDWFSLYFSHLRHVKCDITGNDLKKLNVKPGKMFAKILALVLDAKLSGEVGDRESQLKLARKLADSL